MEEYFAVKRLALILAVQSEIEGMKTTNNDYDSSEKYTEDDFKNKAEELRILAYKHDQQL